MGEEILKVLGILLLAANKFLFAVLPLLAKSPWPLFLSFVICCAGGILGVIFYTFLGVELNDYFKKRFPRKNKSSAGKRRMIRIRNSSGLIGVALLTPAILSIPVGCILATSFVPDKRKIILAMSISVLLWGIILFGVKAILKINIASEITI